MIKDIKDVKQVNKIKCQKKLYFIHCKIFRHLKWHAHWQPISLETEIIENWLARSCHNNIDLCGGAESWAVVGL
jgi:hypothetical protein